MTRILLALVAGVVLWPAHPLHAQVTASASQSCREALAELSPQAGNGGLRPCRVLANVVVTLLEPRLRNEAIAPRDYQSVRGGSAGTAGSVAQTEAVPAPWPVALAGGTISAVGSDAGSNAIAAVSLNPAVFFIDTRDSAAAARLTRVTDATLFVPLDRAGAATGDGLEYVGFRLRINVTGLAQGSALLRRATEAFRSALESTTAIVVTLTARLESLDDPAACTRALLGSGAEAATTCGGPLELRLPAEANTQLRDAMDRARAEADSRYLGLDLRLDLGDPTLGAVADASGTALFAGLAAGRRFSVGPDGVAAGGVRLRLGVRYAALHDSGPTNFSFDGALGFELQRPYEMGEIVASAGLEGRYGNAAAGRDAIQTDFLMFRGSLTIPLTAASGVSLSLAVPLVGADHMSPVLNAGLSWALLLPGARP